MMNYLKIAIPLRKVSIFIRDHAEKWLFDTASKNSNKSSESRRHRRRSRSRSKRRSRSRSRDRRHKRRSREELVLLSPAPFFNTQKFSISWRRGSCKTGQSVDENDRLVDGVVDWVYIYNMFRIQILVISLPFFFSEFYQKLLDFL